MLSNTKYDKLTVHAAPYGIPFYHKIGFRDTSLATEQDGIIYTPMEFFLWEIQINDKLTAKNVIIFRKIICVFGQKVL